jgi:multiple sugar transport system substrate-binding protein
MFSQFLKRTSIRLFLILVLLNPIACQGGTTVLGATAAPNPVHLTFTYWGSSQEKRAIEDMVSKFETLHPEIQIDAQHIASEEYNTRVLSMFAQGTPPDLGYLLGGYAPLWAEEGKVLDLTDVFQSDLDLSSRLPETRYYFGNGRILGTNTAVETVIMFYNQSVFEQAGLDYPPADPDKAWTWSEFLTVAQQLTVDVNGKHPTDADFDPEHIDRYAVSFDRDAGLSMYTPFIYSNGAQMANADGSHLLLDSPEAIEAIQNLRDLMWKYHVMPTPEAERSLPPREVLLQTGKLAMEIGGQWKLLDYTNMTGLKLGLGVLPKFKQPKTMILGSPTVIFSGTTHLAEALTFYKFHNDPQAVDLFAHGLWMPLQKTYYTDPESIAVWTNNPAHPAQSLDVLTRYTLCCVVQFPGYYLKNYGNILEQAIKPALEHVWSDPDVNVASMLTEVVQTAAPLMQGRWDRK